MGSTLVSIRFLKVTFLRSSLNAQPANVGPYHKNDHIRCLPTLLQKIKAFFKGVSQSQKEKFSQSSCLMAMSAGQ